MSFLKVIYLAALFFQISYSLVPKIGTCLKYFLDKNSQKQPLCNEGNHLHIKLDDPREGTLQLYHVIYVEHTHEGCPLPSVESGLSDYILID